MKRGVKTGIFIIAPIDGDVGDRIERLQQTHDPRILKLGKPHLTIAGSSGMGPIDPATPTEALRALLEPIARDTAPLTLKLGNPVKFMQTEIVVLPIDPNGPIRQLHERIKNSGVQALPPRFYFTPHVTLSLYRELPPKSLAHLLTERFADAVQVTRIECHLTRDTGQSRHLLTLELTGS